MNVKHLATVFVGVLGMRVPRLACLRPAAWLKGWPSTARLHQPKLKTLAGRTMQGFLRGGLTRKLSRRRRDQGGGTSRGAHDAIHDDQGQAGAGLRTVLVSSLVQRGQAQARVSSKGNHFGATRSRPAERQDGGHRGAQAGVTTRVFGR